MLLQEGYNRLPPGNNPPSPSQVTLRVDYTGAMLDGDPRGFYRDYYVDEDGQEVEMFVTYFFPDQAREGEKGK